MQAMLSIQTIIRFFVIFLALTLDACQSRQSFIDQSVIPYEKYKEIDSLRHVSNLDKTVATIARLEIIESPLIGFEGRRSLQPDFENLLAKIADSNQLVTLTDHQSPFVRFFAFYALDKQNFSRIVDIYKKHFFDEQRVRLHYGCTIEDKPLNEILGESFFSRLSKNEAKNYRDQLLKKYKNIGGWAL